MDFEKQKRFLMNFAYIAVILGIAIFFCRSIIPAILPFFIAFLVALILKPVIRFLKDRCCIQKNVAGIVLVVLFYGIIGFFIALISIKVFASVKMFVVSLPSTYTLKIKPFLAVVFDGLENFAQRLSPESAAAFESTVLSLSAQVESSIASLATRALGSVGSMALGLPTLFVNTLIAVIATVFLAIDWDVIFGFLMHQIPEKTQNLMSEIKTHLGKTLGSYIKSYALIMLITFCELSLGFVIIRVDNPFGLAAIISVFDILPVVGSGTVLVPWAIISIVTGNYIRALGLGLIYLVIVIVRNIIEPKIIGNKVGLHPIVTLMSMVVGTYIFGPIGLLGLPITLALIQSLNNKGVIHIYKRPPNQNGSPDEGGKTPPQQSASRRRSVSQEPSEEPNTRRGDIFDSES